MSDPFLQALDAQAGVGARLTTAQLEDMLKGIPGARETSGIRDPAHNASVGGVPNSQHIAGTALDFVAPGMSLADAQAKFPGEQVLQHNAGSGMHFHVQGAPGTDVEAQPAPPPQTATPDPYLAALDGATKGGNAGAPANTPDTGDNAGGAPVAAADGPGNQNGPGGFGSTLKSVGSGLAGITPLTDSIVNGRNYFSSLRDDAAGFTSGALKVPETALNVVADLADYAPHGEKVAKALRDSADGMSKWGGNIASDPNSSAYGWGRLGGEVGATLPVTEIAPLAGAAKLAKAGKFASGLARYGDMALQGGAAGAALSGGHDMGKSALEGAVLAPAVGAAGDVLLPPVVKAAGAVSAKAKAIGDKLMSGAADDTAPAVEQTIRKGSEAAASDPWNANGGIGPDGRLTVNIYGGAPEAQAAPPPPPKSATPEALRAAMGSRGARSGIESTTDLPPKVDAHVAQLINQGVPLDQALREADITANGGSPTAADVTRNPALMTAVKEGAKSTSDEGQALSLQAANNNAALHKTAQGIVDSNGGVSAPGDTMQGVAESLKKDSDAAYKQVSDAYETARQVDGDHTVRPDGLRELLNSPEAKAQVAGGGPEGQLITTTQKLIDLYTDNGKNGLTPDQFNSIAKIANQKYDAMGGGVNHWVGEVNKAVDDGLDGFDKAGESFRAARAKMRDYASQYRDPKGVASLIKSDAQGNLVGADTWRSAENMIGSKNDKPFIEIVNQLKKTGNTEQLNRLKAAIVQDAYEAATGKNAGTAADQLANSVFQGSKFHARLNAIGMNKLTALFPPEEIAQLASLGRAGVAVNEAVPGTVNTSHTASAIVNAIKRLEGHQPGIVRKTVSKVMHGAAPVLGALMHGGEGAAAGTALDAVRTGAAAAVEAAAKRKAATKLAEALRTASSPEANRAAESAAAKRMAEALKTRTTARNISKRAAPIAAALKEGHR